MGDTDLSEWLQQMVKKTEEKLELDEGDDTSEQARKLLESWSLQTDNFAPQPKSKATTSKIAQKQKTAVYRKLDTPMMVAKKIETSRPSADPTLIMDARRQHVKEMQAQRMERQAARANAKPKHVVVNPTPPKVSSIDVENDIKSYKQKMAENMRKKKKELEERHRQSMQIRAIEESAQQTIAKENKTNKKKEKKYEQETNEINMEALKVNLQLYMKTRSKRMQRVFYSIWASRCSFNSQTYQRAAAFNRFQVTSRSFSFWKKSFYQRIRQHELNELEERLRKEKQHEQAVTELCSRNIIHNAFVKWSAKYKALIEMKIIEEQHRKRRALLINRIEEQQQEAEKEKEKKSATSSPKRQEPLKPKTKIKPLKIDPKIEAMEKRAEEQRKKKLEKAAKEAQQAETAERERVKAELEVQRKKKLEHQQFLEEEKKKRDEQKRREEEFERALQRKKYVASASRLFRLRRLQLNAFVQWHQIIRIKEQFEIDAENNYNNTLMKKAVTCLLLNKQEMDEEREKTADDFYANKVTHFVFLSWLNVHLETRERENLARHVSEKYLMKTTLEKMILEKRRRQKIKFTLATKHHETYILKACMRVWPIGCAAIKEEERKTQEREDLLQKALKIFDELSDDEDFI